MNRWRSLTADPLEGRVPIPMARMLSRSTGTRQGSCLIRKALVVAYGVHGTGRRKRLMSIDLGEGGVDRPSGSSSYDRSRLAALPAVRLCTSDRREGLKNAIGQVLKLSLAAMHRSFCQSMHQHCRVSERGSGVGCLAGGLRRGRSQAGERTYGPSARAAQESGSKVAELLEAAEEACCVLRISQAHWRNRGPPIRLEG